MKPEMDYPKTSWQGYINFLKKELDRGLTKEEYSFAMKAYIIPITAEKCVEQLKEKKNE